MPDAKSLIKNVGKFTWGILRAQYPALDTTERAFHSMRDTFKDPNARASAKEQSALTFVVGAMNGTKETLGLEFLPDELEPLGDPRVQAAIMASNNAAIALDNVYKQVKAELDAARATEKLAAAPSGTALN